MASLPPIITDASVTLTFGAAGIYYGYCTIADVKFEWPASSINSYTTLTNSVVAQIATYAAQEMQEQLDPIYQMPYVGSDGGILLFLRQVNAKLAFSKLVERFFSGQEPNLSAEAAAARQEAELRIMDVIHGTVRWQTPFGDAIARGMNPVYQTSTGATISPDPGSIDPNIANPIFVISGISKYRSPQF